MSEPTIHELDTITLLHPASGLPAGETGAVLLVEGDNLLVEFGQARGDSVLLTLTVSDVELPDKADELDANP